MGGCIIAWPRTGSNTLSSSPDASSARARPEAAVVSAVCQRTSGRSGHRRRREHIAAAQRVSSRTFAGPRGPKGGSVCHTRRLHLVAEEASGTDASMSASVHTHRGPGGTEEEEGPGGTRSRRLGVSHGGFSGRRAGQGARTRRPGEGGGAPSVIASGVAFVPGSSAAIATGGGRRVRMRARRV